MVEDFGNLDQMNLFADYCFRAGATVVPLRPLGNQRIERIVDNNQANNVRFEGPWRDSGSGVYHGSSLDAVPYRFAVAALNETAVARFQPFFPEAGVYPVYCWARDGADRSNQTYRVLHAGGATEVKVNHRRVGKGWVYLGEYHFERGREGYVEVTNKVDDAADADGAHVVIADAIRFGNGMGDVNRGGGISGHPREEEASRYWIERALPPGGAPIFDATENTDQNNNVGTAPRMAGYMNRELDGSYFDRIFLSFHSNAAGGRGVVGLFENSPEMRPDHQVEWAELIARQQNEDLATTGGINLPVSWVVRKKLTDSHIDFGEIRRDYLNNEMVATISEVAFHDNEMDAQLLRDPGFRMVVARSMLKAVLKFVSRHEKGTGAFTLLPEPPVILSVVTETSSVAVVTWAPPVASPIGGSAPKSYRVYHSIDGFAFDGGIDARTGTSLRVDGLDPAKPHYFRVAADNDGGESLPSKTLGAFAAPDGAGRLLLVSGFSTFSEDVIVSQTVEACLGSPIRGGGELVRVIPRKMNAGNYVAHFGNAVAESARSFDSCALEAFTRGMIALNAYDAVAMQFGRQSMADGVVTEPVQKACGNYLAKGGSLFVSGSETLAWLDDSTTRPSKSDRAFAAKALKARFGATDAGTLAVKGDPSGSLSTATLVLDDGSGDAYRAASCDELVPVSGSRALLRYANARNAVAATAWRQRKDGGNVVVFGFPFETIRDSASRTYVMGQVLKALGVSGAKARTTQVPAKVLKKTPANSEKKASRPVRREG
jgi:hypothetical protein